MNLYHSEVMDPGAVEMWTGTTEETVLRETVKIVNNRAAELGYYPQGYREKDVNVTVTLIEQLPGEQVRRRGLLAGVQREGRQCDGDIDRAAARRASEAEGPPR